MNKLNIKSRIQTRKIVEPSTRDSISTWLDVLTAMLVMPDTQRLQVRDELEDHLRSRVDDLLIMGKLEPEAIRIAVAELGETAELAKLITHAHTKSNPRRKIMNAALITVALAGMSFGGFTFITGTGAPSATPSNGGAVPVVIPEETRREVDKTHAFEIEQASMLEVMNEIALAFDRKIVISVGLREQNFALENNRAIYTLAGQYTFEQAINEIKQQYHIGQYQLELSVNDSEIRFQTLEEHQRSLIETRVYPNPSWITQAHEQAGYAGSLRELLGVKFDLEYTSIQIIGDSIVVAAPPNIHSEFVQLTKELDEVIGKRDASMKTKREQAEAELQHERSVLAHKAQRNQIEQETRRKVAVDLLQKEFDTVREILMVTKENRRLVENELSSMDIFNPDRQSSNEVFEAQVLNLMSTQEKLEFEHDETEERYFYLRSRLLESKYANLFEGLE